MSFTKHNDKSHRAYSIKLVSSNGNTVGYINLNPQFVKVATKKQIENCTVADILDVGPNGLEDYLSKLKVVVVEDSAPDESMSIEDY